MTTLTEVFGPDGLLASHLPRFSFRAPQQQMASLIEAALEREEHAVIEAGTGIGKTYAYVVPLLLSGRRAIISTGTKTLQDQLFARDLPALGRALGRPVDIALLKGRANYLCWHRHENARIDGRLGAALQKEINAVAGWAKGSDSGDLAEFDELEDNYRLKARVTSTVDNCLGGQCPEIDRCFVLKARRRAQAAQVVVVNHHLLLADLGLRESGFGELLPDADAVIVDEAHLLPDIAQQFFDISVSSRQLARLGQDIGDEVIAAGTGAGLDVAGAELGRRVAELVSGAGKPTGRQTGLPAAVADGLAALRPGLLDLAEALAPFGDEPGLARCHERVVASAERLDQVLTGDRDTGLHWLDASEQGFTAHFTPFDVGEAMADQIASQGGSWIFTSASLAVGEDFSHFTSRLGVEPEIRAVLESPFDYPAQGGLYLPSGLPEPNQGDHTEALLAAVYPLIQASGGGCFLLFTSHRALAAADRWLSMRSLPGPMFVQGTGARSALLADFRDAGNGILLGTSSFWQGVDVRGAALRLVVIDKLPFAVPGDPLIQARIEAIRRAGGDPFRSFQLPEAVLTLKQGVGRLIRDYDDYGMVVIGDPRLVARHYGRVFIDSLPPFTRLTDADDAVSFAESLDPGRLSGLVTA